SEPYRSLEGLLAGPRAALAARLRPLAPPRVALVETPAAESAPTELAPLVAALDAAGASAIGVWLPGAASQDPAAPERLAAAAAASPRVVVGLPGFEQGGRLQIQPLPERLREQALASGYSAWRETWLGTPEDVHL